MVNDKRGCEKRISRKRGKRCAVHQRPGQFFVCFLVLCLMGFCLCCKDSDSQKGIGGSKNQLDSRMNAVHGAIKEGTTATQVLDLATAGSGAVLVIVICELKKGEEFKTCEPEEFVKAFSSQSEEPVEGGRIRLRFRHLTPATYGFEVEVGSDGKVTKITEPHYLFD